MNLARNILITLGVLIAVFVGGAYVLPDEVTVSRSKRINAPATTVFALVNDLKEHRQWSPWSKLDPDMKQIYSGPVSGKGQKVSWKSDNPKVGTGSQEIIRSIAPRAVETRLDFGEMGTATAVINIVEKNGKSLVTWSFHTKLSSNPTERWMGLFFDSYIGGQYEKGLGNLKALAENKPS